jgi:hypothetical protein
MHGPANVPAYLSNSSGSWSGLRCTQNFIALFPDHSGNTDHRAQFWDSTQTVQMKDLYTASNGLSTFKFRNWTRDTLPPAHQDTKKDFSDIDFPLFRLGEIYLIYAESVLRGGTGGDAGTALQYINKLRERAYGGAAGDITSGELTTDFILDERDVSCIMSASAVRTLSVIRNSPRLPTCGPGRVEWKEGLLSRISIISSPYPAPTCLRILICNKTMAIDHEKYFFAYNGVGPALRLL